MRFHLAWLLHDIGMTFLRLSEQVQGEGRGPWDEPIHEVEGQFIWAEFERD